MTDDLHARCPRCRGPVNVSEGLRLFQWGNAEELKQHLMLEFWVSLWCHHCQDFTLLLTVGNRDNSPLARVDSDNKRRRG